LALHILSYCQDAVAKDGLAESFGDCRGTAFSLTTFSRLLATFSVTFAWLSSKMNGFLGMRRGKTIMYVLWRMHGKKCWLYQIFEIYTLF